MIVCTLHWYFSPAHLADVEAEMMLRGPPRLRGYMDEQSGAFMLSEGTHRIRAAQSLGLTPVLVSIPWWRSRSRLASARMAAQQRGIKFAKVEVTSCL